MRHYGVDRQVVSTDTLLKTEPTLASFASQIVGGTYTASDKSGDASVSTQALAERCAQRGVEFLCRRYVVHLNKKSNAII